MLYLRLITFWIYCELPITKTAEIQGDANRTGQEFNNNKINGAGS